MFKPKKHLVLVVDDDPRMRDAITEMILSETHYKVITASDGFEAIAQLESNERGFGLMTNRIAAVILDIKMPNMDGLELLKRWRTYEGKTAITPPMFRLPILFLSAYDDLDKRSAAVNINTGCLVGYLKKPVKKATLLHLLKRIILNKDLYSLQEELFKDCWKLP